MSTKVHPRIIERLFRLLGRDRKSTSEEALARAAGKTGERARPESPGSTQDILERAANSNASEQTSYKKGD